MEGALTMRKSMIIPVLLLSLLLTACGGKEASSSRNPFWPELDMDAEETVLVVDGREIPAWRYAYWLALACSSMESVCADRGILVDWDMPLEQGTLGEYAEQQALEDTVLYAVVENWAEEQMILLMEEPRSEGVTDPKGFPMEEWQLQELDAVGRKYREMISWVQSTEDGRLENFAQENGYLTVRRTVFAVTENREEAQRRAEDTFIRINNAVDKEAVFDALADAEGAPDALTVRLGDGTLSVAEEEAVFRLEPGQISGVLEIENGFCILRRLPPDREALAPLWVESELLRRTETASVERTDAFEKLSAAGIGKALSVEKEG